MPPCFATPGQGLNFAPHDFITFAKFISHLCHEKAFSHLPVLLREKEVIQCRFQQSKPAYKLNANDDERRPKKPASAAAVILD